MSSQWEFDEAQAEAAEQCRCCQNALFDGPVDGRCMRCGHERPYHQMTSAESKALAEWLETGDGKRARLRRRKEQMGRLVELGAPAVILASQEQMIRQMEGVLGYSGRRAWVCNEPTHGHLVVWDERFREYRCTGCGHRIGKTQEDSPRATRYKWPWLWLPELRNREWAMVQPGAIPPWFESGAPDS
jgi:DNA-directed RNA polymerase subunit RPC12/RpoP